MKNTMFSGFKLEEFTLTSGKSYGLPLRYYDWSIMMAFISCSSGKRTKSDSNKKITSPVN